MQYSFACPLEGCKHIMTVEAQNDDEAVEKLTEQAREHLMLAHPDVQKNDEQIRDDIRAQMAVVDTHVWREKAI